MNFIDYRVSERCLWRRVILPIESAIHHNTLRNARRTILIIHLQIVSGGNVIREDRLLPVHMAADGFGIGINEQLIRVEAVATLRLPRAINTVAIQLSGFDVTNKSMPYVGGAFTQGDAVGLLPRCIEKAQVHPRGTFRKNGEVSALVGHSGAKRKGSTR